ncbi:hypothetical protein MSAN_02295800 [Mycena sanguinolenta]|uniref:Uncharacterized protein n=1 Tax=Mycena sanguinolenta TaxID=230812 RepID=A0A8H7CIB0_9AGAR|nr:hypothetical protein MSAN_02295800 [Mycena sanguinolenta]
MPHRLSAPHTLTRPHLQQQASSAARRTKGPSAASTLNDRGAVSTPPGGAPAGRRTPRPHTTRRTPRLARTRYAAGGYMYAPAPLPGLHPSYAPQPFPITHGGYVPYPLLGTILSQPMPPVRRDWWRRWWRRDLGGAHGRRGDEAQRSRAEKMLQLLHDRDEYVAKEQFQPGKSPLQQMRSLRAHPLASPPRTVPAQARPTRLLHFALQVPARTAGERSCLTPSLSSAFALALLLRSRPVFGPRRVYSVFLTGHFISSSVVGAHHASLASPQFIRSSFFSLPLRFDSVPSLARLAPILPIWRGAESVEGPFPGSAVNGVESASFFLPSFCTSVGDGRSLGSFLFGIPFAMDADAFVFHLSRRSVSAAAREWSRVLLPPPLLPPSFLSSSSFVSFLRHHTHNPPPASYPPPPSASAPANSSPNPNTSYPPPPATNGSAPPPNGAASISHPGTPNPNQSQGPNGVQANGKSPKLPGIDSLRPASRDGRREKDGKDERRERSPE